MYHCAAGSLDICKAERKAAARRYQRLGRPCFVEVTSEGIATLKVVDGRLVRTGTVWVDPIWFSFKRWVRRGELGSMWRAIGYDLLLLISCAPIVAGLLFYSGIGLMVFGGVWLTPLAMLFVIAGLTAPLLGVALAVFLIVEGCRETFHRLGSVVAIIAHAIGGAESSLLMRTCVRDHHDRLRSLERDGRDWKAHQERWDHTVDCVTELSAQLWWKCRDKWSE